MKSKTKINTLVEKEGLARYLLERLEQLKKKERESGIFLAETRETVTALSTVLNHIRLEGGFKESPDELTQSIFGSWMDKVSKENKEGETIEG